MAEVYIALGSNQGERLQHLRQAVQALGACMRVERSSSVYATAAAYVEDQPPFLNAVVVGTTDLSPYTLLAELKTIEHHMGRSAGIRFGPRPIDLDILLYDDLSLATPGLTIPHPRMYERAFVLQPLAELAPQRVDPALLTQASVGQVLAVIAPYL